MADEIHQGAAGAVLLTAEPYTKMVEELPQMRRETVQLARQAVSGCQLSEMAKFKYLRRRTH